MALKTFDTMRRFYLKRVEDESGVSGSGRVAEGVEFSDGTCAINWLTHTSCTGVYRNIKQLVSIHGHGGKTIVDWKDDLEHVDPADTPEPGSSNSIPDGQADPSDVDPGPPPALPEEPVEAPETLAEE